MEGSRDVPHILSLQAYANVHRSWVVVWMWVAGLIDVDEQWEFSLQNEMMYQLPSAPWEGRPRGLTGWNTKVRRSLNRPSSASCGARRAARSAGSKAEIPRVAARGKASVLWPDTLAWLRYGHVR